MSLAKLESFSRIACLAAAVSGGALPATIATDGVRAIAIAKTEISFMTLADFPPHARTADGLPLQ